MKSEKTKMAMIFGWYEAKLAEIEGDESRAMDMQIWCGQSVGAFNAWARWSI